METHVDGVAVPCVVVFNGGSSSIRFAVYEAGDTLRRRLDGKIDRIGVSDATFIVNDPDRTSPEFEQASGRITKPLSRCVAASCNYGDEHVPLSHSLLRAGERERQVIRKTLVK